MVTDIVVTVAMLGPMGHFLLSSMVVLIGTLQGPKLDKIMVMVMVMNNTT